MRRRAGHRLVHVQRQPAAADPRRARRGRRHGRDGRGVLARPDPSSSRWGAPDTDNRGEATLDLDAAAGTQYLIRVAPLPNSVRAGFRLRVVAPDEPARAPGERLPGDGTSGELDRFANGDDAWAIQMREGQTYRINLVTPRRRLRARRALRARQLPRGGGGVARLRRPRRLYTAALGHLLRPAQRTARLARPAHLPASRRARRSATTPRRAIPLADDRRVRGTLAGNELDALDIYRFTIARRADLRLRLETGDDFDHAPDDGHRQPDRRRRPRRSSCAALQPGRYYVAVRARDGAAGRYTLSRLARTITRARMTVNGGRHPHARARPDRVPLAARYPRGGRPRHARRRALRPDRGLALRGHLPRARGPGTAATVAFRPPFVGRWRVTGSLRRHAHVEPQQRRHGPLRRPRAAGVNGPSGGLSARAGAR